MAGTNASASNSTIDNLVHQVIEHPNFQQALQGSTSARQTAVSAAVSPASTSGQAAQAQPPATPVQELRRIFNRNNAAPQYTPRTTWTAAGNGTRSRSHFSFGRKRDSEGKTQKSTTFSREVVLLRSKEDTMPKGRAKAELQRLGHVISSFTIDKKWSALLVYRKLLAAFENKIPSIKKIASEPKFKIMMGMASELVEPCLTADQELNGEIVSRIFSQKTIWLLPCECLYAKAESSDPSDKNDADTDSNEEATKIMKERYGEGSFFERVCEKCGFLNEDQHSAGVFESANGCLKVYADEQDFSCTKCGYEEGLEAASTSASASASTSTSVQDTDNSLVHFVIEQSKAESEQKDQAPKNLAEALKQRLNKSPNDDHTLIELTRKDIVSKTFECLEDEHIKPRIIVKFLGEEAVDTGGVTREFFTELFKGIAVYSELVRGVYPNITFRHNLMALREGRFELMGKLMAVSALNGCPGPHFLAPSLVKSLFDSLVEVSVDEVPRDCEYLPQLLKIVECTDNSQLEHAVAAFPERFDMGYTKAVVRLEDKGDMIDTCVRHIMISSIAEELSSFKKGLMSFGVFEIMQKFCDEALAHFIQHVVCTEDVKKCFEPVYSNDKSENEKEVEIVYKWNNFLKLVSKEKQKMPVFSCFDLEVSSDPEEKTLSLSDVLQFGSGSRYPNFKGSLLFEHGTGPKRRLSANTCALTITIPVNSRYYNANSGMFANNVTEDIYESFGFGMA